MTFRDRAIRIVDLGRYNKKTDEQIADEILDLISEELPASNRKSCGSAEHYFRRYKDGWNNYRKVIITKLREGRK